MDSTDGVNESFKLQPACTPESAFDPQGSAKLRDSDDEMASGCVESQFFPRTCLVIGIVVRNAYQLLQSNPALAAASATGASDGVNSGSRA